MAPTFLPKAPANMEQATGVRREDRLGARRADAAGFSRHQLFRHFPFRQVVRSRRSATNLRLRQRDKLQTGDHLEQRSRRLADLLRVAQMAGIVIGRDEIEPALRRDRPQLGQELAHIAHLLGKSAHPRLLGLWNREVTIVLEHRAAPRHIDDHRVDLVDVKDIGVLDGTLGRRFFRAGVIMNRAAAGLPARDHDVAAVLLQHAGGGPMGGSEQRIRDTADKERDRGPPRSLGGQPLGQRGFGRFHAGEHCVHASQPPREQPRQADRIDPPIHSESLE